MSIEKINKTFQKGLAIIVSNQPDGVLVHTAKVLGEEIQFLDIAHITPYDNLIYLVGHGSLKKHTIDDKNMSYIASKLIDAGYTGRQNLYITACDAKVQFANNSHRTILLELTQELEHKIKKQILRNIIKRKKIKSVSGLSKIHLNRQLLNKIKKVIAKQLVLNIDSDFDGKSIIIEANNTIEMWVVRDTDKITHKDIEHQKQKQTLFEYKNQWQGRKITDIFSADVRMFTNSEKLQNIDRFKRKLIEHFKLKGK